MLTINSDVIVTLGQKNDLNLKYCDFSSPENIPRKVLRRDFNGQICRSGNTLLIDSFIGSKKRELLFLQQMVFDKK